MAFTKLLTVEENTSPPIVLTLERDGTAINVTGATVSLIITKAGTVTNTGHQTCALTTPSSGIVTYTTNAADFADPGLYNCEIKIVYGDGTVERLYEKFKVSARTKLA